MARVTVELHPAYEFTCAECGQDCLQRPAMVLLDPDNENDAAQIRWLVGLGMGEPIPTGSKVLARVHPETVTCRHCGSCFGAALCGKGPDDEEPDE